MTSVETYRPQRKTIERRCMGEYWHRETNRASQTAMLKFDVSTDGLLR
ncbi:MAG: hypothetical protein ACLUO4_06355 [Christensenellales bacterium]